MNNFKKALSITGIILTFVSTLCTTFNVGANSFEEIKKINEGR